MIYEVTIFPNPIVMQVEADDKQDAENIAVGDYNGSDYSEINRVIVQKIKE